MKRTKPNKKHSFFEHNKDFVSLFQNIPYGTSRIVYNRLIAKFGESHDYSLNYINMCLNPDDIRFNKDVMNEALVHFTEVRLDQERTRLILQQLISEKALATAQ
jgi:hypothetical protein